MRTVIIEDEPGAAARLEKMLLRIVPEAHVAASIPTVRDAVAWFRAHEAPDLVFLDIQLADGLSFRIFDQVEVRVPVIFTTAYDAYALRAFELHSIDYLLKPISEQRLAEAISKFRTMAGSFSWRTVSQDIQRIIREAVPQGKDYRKRFLVSKADRLISVPVSEIACFYAEDKACLLLRGDGKTFFINQSLDEVVQQLSPDDFFRISRKHIISRSFIASVSQYFGNRLRIVAGVDTDQELIVSRARAGEFRDWYGS